MSMYATAGANLGRVEEAKAIFEDVLSTKTRILGHDHPYTQETRAYVQQIRKAHKMKKHPDRRVSRTA